MNSLPNTQKVIEVWADWHGMDKATQMGLLYASPIRGKEIFSFEYTPTWLKSSYSQILDPNLGLFSGPQYPRADQDNFGIFYDSSPDRWGRVLMQRREAQLAREAMRPVRVLQESDYLLGVYDGHRMGALRYKLPDMPTFLDDHTDMASPPWAMLRDLEYASLQIEQDHAEDEHDYMKWLKILIAPGGSLGGARPKASVVDETGQLWIAKFPSSKDEINIGAWEYLVHQLASLCGINVAPAKIQKFSSNYDTFLVKRFDRTETQKRIHFASAMTMLGKKDGDGGETGVSYLHLADFLIKNGANPAKDLDQLWRRIVFNILVSNTDDHLRNHGFLLTNSGWILSPSYDMNPSPTSNGLVLNISKNDNAQNINLALSVAPYFRVTKEQSQKIVSEMKSQICNWRVRAENLRIPRREIEIMENAFRLVDEK
jgi:serine/threonine-protein kinase HipA